MKFLKAIADFFTRYSIGKNESVRHFPMLAKEYSDEEIRKVLNAPVHISVKNPANNKKIKVAIDESIGTALSRKIAARGYDIVCRAGHAETDESWMKRALEEGALFIISPDLDIPSMIERENLPMVWIDYLFASHVNPKLSSDMPKEQKHLIWATYIHERIQSKLKFLTKEFGNKAV